MAWYYDELWFVESELELAFAEIHNLFKVNRSSGLTQARHFKAFLEAKSAFQDVVKSAGDDDISTHQFIRPLDAPQMGGKFYVGYKSSWCCLYWIDSGTSNCIAAMCIDVEAVPHSNDAFVDLFRSVLPQGRFSQNTGKSNIKYNNMLALLDLFIRAALPALKQQG